MGLFGFFKNKKRNLQENEENKKNNENEESNPKLGDFEEYEKYGLLPLMEYISTIGKLESADKALFEELTGNAYPTGGKIDLLIADMYVYNLLFSSEELGGFGISKDYRDICVNSSLYQKLVAKVYAWGSDEMYKKITKFAKTPIIVNKHFEIFNILNKKALIDNLEAYDELIIPKIENANEDTKEEYLYNPESYVYDKRLLLGDKETIEYKLKACYFISLKSEEYELFRRDENGNKTEEYITPSDILPLTTENDIIEFIDYIQS